MANQVADDFNVVPTKPGVHAVVDDFNTVPVQPRPPGNVSDLLAVPLDGGAAISWTDNPSGDPFEAITGHTVTVVTTGGLSRTYSVPAASTSFQVQGLTNDVTWTIGVVATNPYGSSAPITTSVVPSAGSGDVDDPTAPVPVVPGTPNLTSVETGMAAARVSWTAPLDDGGNPITSYRVVGLGADGAVVTVVYQVVDRTQITYSVTLGPLTNGVSYDVYVAARTVAGESALAGPISVVPADDGTILEPPPIVVVPKTPPAEPLVGGFPVGFPMAPSFYLQSPEEAGDILAQENAARDAVEALS